MNNDKQMMGYSYILTSDGQLYHHGVKGQKWGVRRYQNKDGSLTKAGKKHYSKQEIEDLRTELAKRRASTIDIGKTAAQGALTGIGGLALTAGTIATAGVYSPVLLGMSIVSLGMSAAVGAGAAISGIKVSSLKAELRRATADR